LSLVNGAGLKHREDKIAREFIAQIFNDAFGRTCTQRFLDEPIEFFFLANVSTEGDNLRVVVLFQPGENNRGVETA
jgi:hypothetical protein